MAEETVQQMVEKKFPEVIGEGKLYPTRAVFDQIYMEACKSNMLQLRDKNPIRIETIDSKGLSPPKARILGVMIYRKEDDCDRDAVSKFETLAREKYPHPGYLENPIHFVSFSIPHANNVIESLIANEAKKVAAKEPAAGGEDTEIAAPSKAVSITSRAAPVLVDPHQRHGKAKTLLAQSTTATPKTVTVIVPPGVVDTPTLLTQKILIEKAAAELDKLDPYMEEEAQKTASKLFQDLFGETPFAKQKNFLTSFRHAVNDKINIATISDWLTGETLVNPATLAQDNLVTDMVQALGINNDMAPVAERVFLAIPFQPKANPLPQLMEYARNHPEMTTKAIVHMARYIAHKDAKEYAASMGITDRALYSLFELPPRTLPDAIGTAIGITDEEDMITWRKLVYKIPLNITQANVDACFLPGENKVDTETKDPVARPAALEKFFTALRQRHGFFYIADMARDIAAKNDIGSNTRTYFGSVIGYICKPDNKHKILNPTLAAAVAAYAFPDNSELKRQCEHFLSSRTYQKDLPPSKETPAKIKPNQMQPAQPEELPVQENGSPVETSLPPKSVPEQPVFAKSIPSAPAVTTPPEEPADREAYMQALMARMRKEGRIL